MFCTDKSSERSRAAFMAATLDTMRRALPLEVSPRRASAIFRDPAVRFSICELAADSLRSRRFAKGAVPAPISASNRTISMMACSTMAWVRESRWGVQSAMGLRTAAW
jgi:hypothetical protein